MKLFHVNRSYGLLIVNLWRFRLTLMRYLPRQGIGFSVMLNNQPFVELWVADKLVRFGFFHNDDCSCGDCIPF